MITGKPSPLCECSQSYPQQRRRYLRRPCLISDQSGQYDEAAWPWTYQVVPLIPISLPPPAQSSWFCVLFPGSKSIHAPADQANNHPLPWKGDTVTPPTGLLP